MLAVSALTIILGVAGLLLNLNVDRVSVENCSDKSVAEGSIDVCGRRYAFSRIEPGGSVEITFPLSSEKGGFKLQYRFSQKGKEFISEEVGQVVGASSRPGSADSFKIYDDRLEYCHREGCVQVPIRWTCSTGEFHSGR
ncbi:MAG: hypothetical protein KC777_22540 [Cyanobacteria bacterium HKST-UBA02]|nr:hypothetical protein [Cyanobacteria bacterium HKST-UBA02]